MTGILLVGMSGNILTHKVVTKALTADKAEVTMTYVLIKVNLTTTSYSINDVL